MKRRLAVWMYARAIRWYPELGSLVYLALRRQIAEEIGQELAVQQALVSHQAAVAARASRQ